jgi:hypothetical protein
MRNSRKTGFGGGAKLGKKLTNNFIILCELRSAAAKDHVTQS